MTTEATEMLELALQLAMATTWCRTCDGGGKIKVPQYGEGQKDPCPDCKEAPGKAYLLDASVRVKCIPYIEKHFHDRGVLVEWSLGDKQEPCRGWTLLDPRFGWEWMQALAKAGFRAWACSTNLVEKMVPTFGGAFHALLRPIEGPGFFSSEADTPGLAFLQAASKAIKLDTPTEN